MSDLIDRQAAIDALCKAGCDSGYCGISCDDVKAIEQLPSAQPELIEKKAYIRGFEQGRTQGMIDSQGGKK